MIWQSLNFVWVRDGVRSWEGDAFSYMNILQMKPYQLIQSSEGCK